MSSNVVSIGIMGVLETPLSEEEREDFMDKNEGFYINYEGTLIYCITNHTEEPGMVFIENQLIESPLEFSDSARFVCLWYNGADSDMDLMTVEDFYRLTAK